MREEPYYEYNFCAPEARCYVVWNQLSADTPGAHFGGNFTPEGLQPRKMFVRQRDEYQLSLVNLQNLSRSSSACSKAELDPECPLDTECWNIRSYSLSTICFSWCCRISEGLQLQGDTITSFPVPCAFQRKGNCSICLSGRYSLFPDYLKAQKEHFPSEGTFLHQSWPPSRQGFICSPP